MVNQSPFNPEYAHAHLLDRGFLPALGIAVPWTLYVLTLHTVWSISVPILLVEELTGGRRTRPWLGRIGLGVVVVLLVLAARVTAVFTKQTYGLPASITKMATVVVVAAILVLLALMMPRHRSVLASRPPAPSPWLVFAAAFIAASLFVGLFKLLPAWAVVGLDLLLFAGMLLAVAPWSVRPGWGASHRLTLGGAALVTYAWHSFFTTPVEPVSFGLALGSHAVFAAAAAVLLGVEVRAVGQHERDDIRRDRPTHQESMRR